MTRRTFAAAGVIAGTIALLVGANTNAWWTAREGKQTLRFGLRSLTSCLDGCGTVEYTQLTTGNEAWLNAFIIFGRVAFYGAFAGAVLAAGTVVVALTVKRRLPFTPGVVGAAVNGLLVVAGIAFIIARRGDGATLSLGYSMFLYILGAFTVSVGCAVLVRTRPIVRPGYPAPISTGEAIPACPRCRAPMEWAAEHGRFYCAKCSLYV